MQRAGRVVALAVRGPGTARPDQLGRARALAGIGLEGDVHADSGSPRQVLLAGAPAYDELQLPPLALRENLLLDLDTAALESGMLLRVGRAALLRLSFQCEACAGLGAHLAGLSGGNKRRRGMLARVLRGGEIRAGDPVSILAERMPALPEDWRERIALVLAAVPAGLVIGYADLARVAGIQSSYCRAFPRVLAALGPDLAARAVSAQGARGMPLWSGAAFFDGW